MNNVSIKMKLCLIMLCISVVLILQGSASIYGLSEVNTGSAEISEQWIPRINTAGKINALTADYRRTQYYHMTAQSDAQMREAEQLLAGLEKQIDENFAEYETYLVNPERKALCAKAKADWQDYIKKLSGSD